MPEYKEIIDDALSGDAIGFQEKVESILLQKANDAIDNRRPTVSASMFDLEESAGRILASGGKYKLVSRDGVARVMVGNKEIAGGDFDRDLDGWWIGDKNHKLLKGKGQIFFDDAQKIIDFFIKGDK